MTLGEELVIVRYRLRVIPSGRASIATSLIDLWERPWSGTALRYACHAMHATIKLGIDVLEETPRPLGEYNRYL